MGSLKAISEDLKLIDLKKESLKKAFDALQAHSSFLPFFSPTWSDIDAYFTSVQNSLTEKYHVLESLESQQNLEKKDEFLDSVSPRPGLKEFCLNMDGRGLRNYVIAQPKGKGIDRMELAGAINCAEDPAKLVLDAMDGFYSENLNCKRDKDPDLCFVRRTCLVLLETLMDSNPSVGFHVKESARTLALEWKKHMSTNGENPLEALGFLHLVATYGLKSEFDLEELVEYFTIIGRYRQATKLCKNIGFGNKVADLVQKLIRKGKQLLAVKFIFEFELTDKFPPVPLLKEYVKESSELAKNVCKEGHNSLKAQNEATSKEVGALRSVIKMIEDYNLDSEYPKVNLEKRIELLEKQKADRKRPASGPPTKTKKQKLEQVNLRSTNHIQAKKNAQWQTGKQPRRMTSMLGSRATPSVFTAGKSLLPPYQQSHVHSSDSLSNHPVPYESLSAVPYDMVGLAPSVTSYPGAFTRVYGFADSHEGSSGNAGAANAHLYPTTASYTQSDYYDQSAVYGAYGMPQSHHPSYHSQ